MNHLQPRVKYGGISVMICGIIWNTVCSALVEGTGNIIAAIYISYLS